MFVVLAYDIELSKGGEKRLRKVAKICENYGIRVQNSVFELQINREELALLKDEIQRVIENDKDSIRIYNLGNSKRKNQIDVIGKNEKIEIFKDSTYFFNLTISSHKYTICWEAFFWLKCINFYN